MLHFITGTDGTGKSKYLRNKALNLAQNGKRVLFVVPEQFSFLTEKFFYEKENSAEIEVASFEKVERKIFSSLGKTALPFLSPEEKTVMMWRAVQECSDILSDGGKIYRYPDSLQNLTEFSNTLRSYSASAASLLEKTQNKSEALKQKARDISYILDSYEALIEGKYMDICGSLDAAVDLYMSEEDIFPDTVIFDEFWYLTGEQKNLIIAFLERGKEVYLPIECEEDLRSFAFSLPQKTLRQLRSAADEKGIEWEIAGVFSEDKKHITAEMRALWSAYKSDGAQNIESIENITLTECPDGYSEVDLMAARINDLVQSGWRYSDFAVIACGTESYRSAISDAFRKWGIPAFTDFRSKLSESVLSTFAENLLLSAISPDSDLYISMLKSGLIKASEEEILALDKYVFIWNINGREFEKEFKLSPFGFSGRKDSKEETRQLKIINELRGKIVSPIIRFRDKCKKGENITKVLYEALWNGYEINERMDEIFSGEEYLTAEGSVLKERAEGVFNAFSSLLDSLYRILGDAPITLREYKDVFSMFSSLVGTGSVPQNKDAVPVGEPGRVRTDGVRAVFVLGAGDGAFPAVKNGGDLLTRKEKASLKSDGFDFIKMAEESYAEELFTVYKTLMLPREKLFISYPKMNFSGEAVAKSEIFADLEVKLCGVKMESFDDIDRTIFIKSEAGAFSEMARCFREVSEYSEALRVHLRERGRRDYIDILSSSSLTVNGKVKNRETLNSLYPEVLRISASKAEMFFKCRFSYFCRYTLGIQPWKKAELAPSDTGTLIHYVLEKVVAALVSGGIEREEIDEAIEKTMAEYLKSALGGEENKDIRFMRAFKSVGKLLSRLVKHMAEELSQSEFVPTDFELSVTDDDAVTPLEISLPSGKKLLIEGIVDRVDIYEKNGKKYVRVVDYKSGKKEFALSEINDGINMQMLMYLMVLSSSGKGKYEGALPAGVLYMPAKEPSMIKGRNLDKEKIEAELQKTYKMKGLVLNDTEVLSAMERNLGGKFIPVVDKKGEITSQSLATLEEFGIIGRKINENLMKMAEILSEGEFSVMPLESPDGHRPCEYCDYKSICGADDLTPAKIQTKMDTEEVLKEMKESYGKNLD